MLDLPWPFLFILLLPLVGEGGVSGERRVISRGRTGVGEFRINC